MNKIEFVERKVIIVPGKHIFSITSFTCEYLIGIRAFNLDETNEWKIYIIVYKQHKHNHWYSRFKYAFIKMQQPAAYFGIPRFSPGTFNNPKLKVRRLHCHKTVEF